MKSVNTVKQVLTVFRDQQFGMDRWRAYAKEIHPDLPDFCEKDTGKYEFETMVLPVLASALKKWERIEKLGSIYEEVMDRLLEQLSVLFDRDCPATVILYLGLCNGAGCAGTLGEERVILLGIEKILELAWDSEEKLRALLYHEIGHIWHDVYGVLERPAETLWQQSVLQLWQEGIAMVCEQILMGDDEYYHQDQDGWLTWCREHEKRIKAEYLRRCKQQESTQDFFGDWCAFEGHSDVGYYLGCQFIRWIMEKRRLQEISRMKIEELAESFTDFACQ